MEVRAVAHVLEEVVIFDERRGADPLRAFATHLGDAGDMAGLFTRHDADHAVAADAGTDQRTLGNKQARVVRAAGAEERCAHGLDAQGDAYRLGLANGGELVCGNS